MTEYRLAAPADAQLMACIRWQSWKETYPGIYPEEMLTNYDVPAVTERFAARLEDPAYRGYLLLCDGEVGGYAFVGPPNFGPYKDFELCLNNLYILQKHQRKGLGKLAFAAIANDCKQWGIARFFCGCNANNRNAVDFYRHMGGVQGEEAPPDVPQYDQIIHFEFYLGE